MYLSVVGHLNLHLQDVCQHGHLASATEVFYFDKMFSGSSEMTVYHLCLGATGRFLCLRRYQLFVQLREICDHKFDLI